MNDLPIHTAVKVTYSTGAYDCRIGEQKASSVTSAKEAVTRLARKVFGDQVVKIVQGGTVANHLVSWWLIKLRRRRELVTVTHPAWRPVHGQPDIVVRAHTFTGERTAFGLVLHRRIGWESRRFDFYDVSDPITGGLVAHGEYPGRMAAIAALVQKAVELQNHPLGIRGALQIARQRFLADSRLVTQHE